MDGNTGAAIDATAGFGALQLTRVGLAPEIGPGHGHRQQSTPFVNGDEAVHRTAKADGQRPLPDRHLSIRLSQYGDDGFHQPVRVQLMTATAALYDRIRSFGASERLSILRNGHCLCVRSADIDADDCSHPEGFRSGLSASPPHSPLPPAYFALQKRTAPSPGWDCC